MAWLAVQTGVGPEELLELDPVMFKALRAVAIERLENGQSR